MTTRHNYTARLDDEEKAMLGRLAAKLGIARAGVLRMAIRRLAEVEGVVASGPFRGPSSEGAEAPTGEGELK